MKCVKFGVIDTGLAQDYPVSISSLGFTSTNDYMIILSGDGLLGNGGTGILEGHNLSVKTTTSFTVTVTGANIGPSKVSYQIISFV